jgi:hypothetical protein
MAIISWWSDFCLVNFVNERPLPAKYAIYLIWKSLKRKIKEGELQSKAAGEKEKDELNVFREL